MRLKDLNDTKLYHATYTQLIPAIKREGLGGKTSNPNWEDSKRGVVYLATDPDVAMSYAETSDSVPDEWLESIVVFSVPRAELNSELLTIDKNVQNNDGSTLQYNGKIPFEKLTHET